MDQRDLRFLPSGYIAPMDLLSREKALVIDGNPESVSTSDHDSEDYFVTPETSQHSISSSSDGKQARADSKKPELPIAILARPVQRQSQAAITQPSSRKASSSKAAGKQPAPTQPELRRRASQEQLNVHPALRTGPVATNTTSSIFDYEAQTRYPSWIPPYVPTREIPVYFSPEMKAGAAPPIQSPQQQQQRQLRRTFSNIFEFGRSDTYDFEVTANNPPPKPFRKRSKDKIDQLGQKLSKFNVSSKVKQVVGRKRSRQDSPAKEPDTQPLMKMPRTNDSIHCQTCQCPAAVRDSLSRMSMNSNLPSNSRPTPPPPPPRPGVIRQTTTVSVTETELPSGYMTPRHDASSYYVLSSEPSSRAPPLRNEEALAILEGRSTRPWYEPPVELTREDPDCVFTLEERRQLRAAIEEFEDMDVDEDNAATQEIENPFSDTCGRTPPFL